MPTLGDIGTAVGSFGESFGKAYSLGAKVKASRAEAAAEKEKLRIAKKGQELKTIDVMTKAFNLPPNSTLRNLVFSRILPTLDVDLKTPEGKQLLTTLTGMDEPTKNMLTSVFKELSSGRSRIFGSLREAIALYKNNPVKFFEVVFAARKAGEERRITSQAVTGGSSVGEGTGQVTIRPPAAPPQTAPDKVGPGNVAKPPLLTDVGSIEAGKNAVQILLKQGRTAQAAALQAVLTKRASEARAVEKAVREKDKYAYLTSVIRDLSPTAPKDGKVASPEDKKKALEDKSIDLGIVGRIERIADAAVKLSVVDPQASRALSASGARLAATPTARAAQARAVAIAKHKAIQDAPIGPRLANFMFGNKDLAVNAKKSRTDLAAATVPRFVPTEEQIDTLQDREVSLLQAMNTSRTIINRITNNPEILSAPGAFARTWTGVLSSIEGFVNLFPGAKDLLDSVRYDDLKGVLSGRLASAGYRSAQVQSMVIALTFQGGALVETTGKGMSDKDFENLSLQIARSTASPELMTGVLRSYNLLQNQAYSLEYKVLTGAARSIGMPSVNTAEPFADLQTDALDGIIVELLTDKQFELYRSEVIKRTEANENPDIDEGS